MREEQMKIPVTVAAGFIGMHVARRLPERASTWSASIISATYYDVAYWEDCLKQLFTFPGFRFAKLDMGDRAGMDDLFGHGHFERVVNLAVSSRLMPTHHLRTPG